MGFFLFFKDELFISLIHRTRYNGDFWANVQTRDFTKSNKNLSFFREKKNVKFRIQVVLSLFDLYCMTRKEKKR